MTDEARRKMRGCDEPSPNMHLRFAPRLRRCPWSQIELEAYVAIGWHREFTRLRVLPFGGSDLMDQPAFVYEAIVAADNAKAEVDAEIERQRAESREHD